MLGEAAATSAFDRIAEVVRHNDAEDNRRYFTPIEHSVSV